MKCRFEEESNGRTYPRSCPTCGFGPCKRGFEQIKYEMGGYHIKRPDGSVYKPPQFGGAVPEKPAPVMTAAEIGDAAWRDRASEVVIAAARPKLSRVTRARMLDAIEAALKEALDHKTEVAPGTLEKETEGLCEKLLTILYEND